MVVVFGFASGQARGGGTLVVNRVTGGDSCAAFVVVGADCWTGVDIGGGGADDWAREANGSNQGSATVARMTVNLPIRSIGRSSLPSPPDRNLRRSDSDLTGRQMVYRLVPIRMLMANAAILSPRFDQFARAVLGVVAKCGEIGLAI